MQHQMIFKKCVDAKTSTHKNGEQVMMNKLSVHEQARLQKLIREGKAAVSRIENNLKKVTERLTKKRAA